MNPALNTIMNSSRGLLSDMNLSYPVRKLASIVVHGAGLIDRHSLDQSFALPQFERALFHLCHVADRPLCGRNICQGADIHDVQKCSAVLCPE